MHIQRGPGICAASEARCPQCPRTLERKIRGAPPVLGMCTGEEITYIELNMLSARSVYGRQLMRWSALATFQFFRKEYPFGFDKSSGCVAWVATRGGRALLRSAQPADKGPMYGGGIHVQARRHRRHKSAMFESYLRQYRRLFARLPTYGLVSFDTHADPAITVIPRLF